jgi:hypothetical protein
VTDNDVVLGLTVRIKNQGSPTIIEGWRLKVKLPGDIEREGLLLTPPPGMIKGPKPSDLSYSNADSLADKTITSPIPTGGAVTGNLLFLVRGISKNIASEGIKGAVLDLAFSDVNGSVSHIHSLALEKENRSISVPGLQPPQ